MFIPGKKSHSTRPLCIPIRWQTLRRTTATGAVLAAFLTACGSDPTTPGAAMKFAATTTVTGSGTSAPAIHVNVTATNRGLLPIPYQGNTCGAVRFALYREAARTGPPVWHDPGMICLLYAQFATLAPTQTVTLMAFWPTGNPDFDGAGPPAGTYFVSATVMFAGVTKVLDAGTVTIAR